MLIPDALKSQTHFPLIIVVPLQHFIFKKVLIPRIVSPWISFSISFLTTDHILQPWVVCRWTVANWKQYIYLRGEIILGQPSLMLDDFKPAWTAIVRSQDSKIPRRYQMSNGSLDQRQNSKETCHFTKPLFIHTVIKFVAVRSSSHLLE